MCRYGDHNLIRYEDAIRLHVDTTGTVAWITMKNYGMVFHKFPWAAEEAEWNRIKEITIGIPADEIDAEIWNNISVSFGSPPFQPLQPDPSVFSISEMLDAIDVIKFQSAILNDSTYFQGGHYWSHTSRSRFKVAYHSAPMIGKVIKHLTPILQTRLSTANRHMALHRSWAPELFALLRENSHGWILEKIRDCKRLGLTAYFPFPVFIVQEQRTKQKAAIPSQTQRRDQRKINPICCPTWNQETINLPGKGSGKTGPFVMQEFLDALDEDRKRLGNDAFINLTPDRQASLHPKSFPENCKVYLHEHLKRGNYYAFRGDKREPLEIFQKSGFLPGITRKDDGVKQYWFSGAAIDWALKGSEVVRTKIKETLADTGKIQEATKWSVGAGLTLTDGIAAALAAALSVGEPFPRQPNAVPSTWEKKIATLLQGAKSTNDRDQRLDAFEFGVTVYEEILKELDALTLGVFTQEQDFKAFVSATASTAIAKCFANFYDLKDECIPVNCYAVRCRGAFHLPTDKKEHAIWDQKKDAKNAMTHNAEQEIAVPGAIWWSDVAGLRVIRIDRKKGQFFCGPVFMRDTLRKAYREKKGIPGHKDASSEIFRANLKSQIHLLKGKPPSRERDEEIARLIEILRTLPQDNAPVEMLQADDGAFCELFELLSGKSQGVGFDISWSYRDPPFDLPDLLFKGRDNSRIEKRLAFRRNNNNNNS